MIDLTREGVQLAAHAAPDQAKELAWSATDLCNQDKAQSLAVPTLPRKVEMLMQPAANVLVQLGEDLATPRTVVQPAADLAVPSLDASINDAIDQLIAELTAFCLDQLKKSVTSSDGVDLNADADVLENEFKVSVYIARGT